MPHTRREPALQAAGRTHQGLVRPGNEDSFVCGDRVFAVADGVGGHPAGEVASALALEPLVELDERAEGDIRAALADAVREANRRVHQDAAAHPERTGMATTLTAAAVAEGAVQLAHVGDSRAYLLRPGEGLRRLTVDHTPVEQAVVAGELSPEEADLHPLRHTLDRVLGTGPEIGVDVPEPLALASGDRLLLCSDGLTEATSEREIAGVLESSDDPESAAEGLVQAALAGGGPDNITVVVVTA
jgi:protein phosphatase